MIRTTRCVFIVGLLIAAGVASAPAQQYPPVQQVTAQHGMVVAQESRAALIGAEVLKRGGNAVDAAVAVGFAMPVTYPRAGNIGGGGYMVIHLAARRTNIAIDYRETAPAATTRDIFLDERGNADPRKSRDSALAIGIPGSVAGLALAHQRFGSGRLTLAERGQHQQGQVDDVAGGHADVDHLLNGPWLNCRAGFGRLTLRDALRQSLNTVAVRLSIATGRQPIADLAARLGVSTPLKVTRSLPLGSSELTVMDQATGMMLNANMESYRLAGYNDIPELVVRMMTGKGYDERGVIGLGEPAVISPGAAISNAVANAIGVRVSFLPLTPDRVLAALGQKAGA